jgi:hypothetical protein
MRFSRPAAFAFCLIGRALSAQAHAVDPASIVSGTSARITEFGAGRIRMSGTVLDVSHDSLNYRFASDGTTRSLGWNDVAKMDVTIGQHRHFVAGMLVGVLLGAGTGALIGSSSASGNDGYTPSAVGSMGAIAGAMGGFVLGSAVGIFYKTDAWVPVAIPHSVR